MKKRYQKTAGLFLCALLAGTFTASQTQAQKLVTYRFGELIPDTCEEAADENLLPSTVAPGIEASTFTLNTVIDVDNDNATSDYDPYDRDDIISACQLREFLSFTGDSMESPACNSEPWQPVACGAEYCEDGQVVKVDDYGEPLYDGWPCCEYEKGWLYKITPIDPNSQLVLNGLVLDSRRLAPGVNGTMNPDMPGVTGFEVWVNGARIAKKSIEEDNDWHNVTVIFEGEDPEVPGTVIPIPVVLETGESAEIEMRGTGSQLDDPIPWRIDTVQLLGVETFDGSYPDSPFILRIETGWKQKKTVSPMVNLSWTPPPTWTGTAPEWNAIQINRNGTELDLLFEGGGQSGWPTTYQDTELTVDASGIYIYEACLSLTEGELVTPVLCTNTVMVEL